MINNYLNNIDKLLEKVDNIVQVQRELTNAHSKYFPVRKSDIRPEDMDLHQRLTEANIKKDAGILEEVLTHLRTMRDTWKEVMVITNNGNNIQVS